MTKSLEWKSNTFMCSNKYPSSFLSTSILLYLLHFNSSVVFSTNITFCSKPPPPYLYLQSDTRWMNQPSEVKTWRKHCVNYHSFSHDNDTFLLLTNSTALLLLSQCSFAKQFWQGWTLAGWAEWRGATTLPSEQRRTLHWMIWDSLRIRIEMGQKIKKIQVLVNISQVLYK